MKRIKILWYSLMLALLLAGLVSGRREYYLILFTMGFVVLYSFMLNLWTLFSFSCKQTLDKEAGVKGGENSLRMEVHNKMLVPFAFMRLDAVPVAQSQKEQFCFSLLPKSRVAFTLPLPCPYRGVFGVGMTKLEVNDSFGLVKTRFNMQRLPHYHQAELKIYPRLIKLPALLKKIRDSKEFGNISQQLANQGESYAGLRSYRPGDPLKRVHWAASARKQELHVKTYDAPVEASVRIVLDTWMEPGLGEDGFYLADLACECAAAIAYCNIRAGHRVAFHCASLQGKEQSFSTMKGFHRFYDSLATLPFHEQGSLSSALHGVSFSNTLAAYVISTRKENELSKDFPKRIQAYFIPLSIGDDVMAVFRERTEIL